MPTKTLYVKDQQLWEEAKSLAGPQGLSEVVAQLLAKWVADKEKQKAMKSGKEFTEIELWVGGDEHELWHPKDPVRGDYKIAFTGRLLHSTEHEPVIGLYPQVDVYQMSSRQLVVYRTWRPPFFLGSGLSPGYDGGATYKMFSDYEEIRRSPEMLDTYWGDTEGNVSEEDKMQVLVERTRTARERLIISLAGVWQKEQVKEFLLTLSARAESKDGDFTEQEIDHCYEKEKQAACNLKFQQDIANALGAELVVRID